MPPRAKSSRNEAAPERQRSLRIHGKVAREIGISIVSGRYRPGEILHGEIDASDRLKVSRTAYREAIRILAAKGLVQSRPKVGTRVSPQAEWHLLDPDVLGWMFDSEPNEVLLESLFELRKIIEPEAAALAARRRSDHHLTTMYDSLRDMGEHTLHTEAGRLADRNFHAALLSASGNAFLMSLTSGVSAAISWTTVYKQRVMPKHRDPVPDHERVYEAIAARDTEAARRAMMNLVDMAFLDASKAQRPRKRRGKRGN